MFKKVIYIGLTVSFGFMLAVGLIGYSQSVKADTQSANDLGNATEFLKSITPENQDFAGKLLDYIKSFTSLDQVLGGLTHVNKEDFNNGISVNGTDIISSTGGLTVTTGVISNTLTVTGTTTINTDVLVVQASENKVGINVANPNAELTLASSSKMAIELGRPLNGVATARASGTLEYADTFYFEVTAVRGSGETIVSDEVSCDVDPTTTTACQVTWDVITGADSYKVYTSTTTGQYEYYYTATTTAPIDTRLNATSTLVAGTPPVRTTAYTGYIANDGLNSLTGWLAVGTTTPAAIIQGYGITEQLRLSYDETNYAQFTVSSGGDLNIDPSGGNTGINTSTPASLLDIYSTATSTVIIDSNTKGGCLCLKDLDSAGYTCVAVNDGVANWDSYATEVLANSCGTD